jgi:hypothetical protein
MRIGRNTSAGPVRDKMISITAPTNSILPD